MRISTSETGLRNPIAPGSQAEQVGRLLLAGALVLLLPLIPFGAYVLYPFVILTTWFHEMAHGLAAMLVGWDFQRLVILPDGSVDPWHSLALVEPLTPLQQALNLTPVFIDGAPSLPAAQALAARH